MRPHGRDHAVPRSAASRTDHRQRARRNARTLKAIRRPRRAQAGRGRARRPQRAADAAAAEGKRRTARRRRRVSVALSGRRSSRGRVPDRPDIRPGHAGRGFRRATRRGVRRAPDGHARDDSSGRGRKRSDHGPAARRVNARSRRRPPPKGAGPGRTARRRRAGRRRRAVRVGRQRAWAAVRLQNGFGRPTRSAEYVVSLNDVRLQERVAELLRTFISRRG